MLVSGIVGCGLALGFMTGAWAGQALSDYGYYSDNGVDYRNHAAINTSSSSAYSVVLVSPRNKSVAGGWVGAMPQIYRNGALWCTGTYTYNSAALAVNAVHNPTGCHSTGVASWQAKGVTKSWNGSAYNAWWTSISPAQNS